MTPCSTCGDALRQPARGRRRRYCSRSCQARAYRARRSTVPGRVRPVPRRLSTVEITRTAVALADHAGLDGLTMRRLAAELGVTTAALYRHIGDRDRLLASMTDLVLTEIPPPPDRTGWRARMHYEAQQEWQLYRRHPWLLAVLARVRPPLGQGLFDALERAFAALDRLELPRARLLSAYLGYSALIQGLALVWSSERLDRIGGADAAAGIPAELAGLIDPRIRPTLHKVFDPAATQPELDFERLLEEAVDMLLEGVAVGQAAASE